MHVLWSGRRGERRRNDGHRVSDQHGCPDQRGDARRGRWVLAQSVAWSQANTRLAAPQAHLALGRRDLPDELAARPSSARGESARRCRPGLHISIAFFGLGILAGTLPLVVSPVFRQVVRAIPATWLIGIHVIRLAGFLFLALMDMHLLPAAFAVPAGYGDMTVGLLAIGVIYLLATHNPHARVLAIGWNLLGLLDLGVAVMVGLTIVGPFSAQVVASGISPVYLNYLALVPSFAVPLYAVLHLYSWFHLVPARADATRPGVRTPATVPGFARSGAPPTPNAAREPPTTSVRNRHGSAVRPSSIWERSSDECRCTWPVGPGSAPLASGTAEGGWGKPFAGLRLGRASRLVLDVPRSSRFAFPGR